MSVVESRRVRADESRDLLRAAVVLCALLSTLLLLAFGADWLLRTDNFPVRNVRFEGEFKHVTEQELEASVAKVVRGNFFLIDLNVVKERVESLPWVYRASVRRQWPQDVHIRFTEQQLSARWGGDAYLNQAGDVVRVTYPAAPSDLPRLEGPDGSGALVLEHYRKFSQILAVAGERLERVALTPQRIWRLELATGTVIVLDRAQSEYKLERFARVYAQALKPQGTALTRVDLRYANGFSVQKAGAVAAGHRNAPAGTESRGTGTATKG